jgi:hypothetical protein
MSAAAKADGVDQSIDGYRRGIATEDVDPKAIVIR